MTQSSVTISARGEERIRSGHPWIYRADVSTPTPDLATASL
jgi:hypothetical protein